MDLWKIEKIEKSIQVLWHLSNTCWLTGDSKLSTGCLGPYLQALGGFFRAPFF